MWKKVVGTSNFCNIHSKTKLNKLCIHIKRNNIRCKNYKYKNNLCHKHQQ